MTGSISKQRRRWLIYLLFVAVILGVTGAQALEVGDRAPDFNLRSTAGDLISLSQFKGKKGVLIQFYSMDFNPS
jgi:hypothetical protein